MPDSITAEKADTVQPRRILLAEDGLVNQQVACRLLEVRGHQVVIANNGVSVPILHRGDPPQLFKPGIPVVLEGHFDQAGTFESDLIMVKHTESYVAAHPDRVKTAETTIPSAASPGAP